MKLTYFLQELKKIPLGYSFRLYTYGPYDAQVLEDLRTAIDEDAVIADAFRWQGGLGYELKPGKKAPEIMRGVSTELERFTGDIDWVVGEFGMRSASDLEVASTIIYVDRSSTQSNESLTTEQLASRVHDVKPHHSQARINAMLADLKGKGLLAAVS